jgi:hypothetical protein
MTEAVLAEARRYLQVATQQARERGQNFPTSGERFERALRTAAKSFDQLHRAARLAERNTQSKS